MAYANASNGKSSEFILQTQGKRKNLSQVNYFFTYQPPIG